MILESSSDRCFIVATVASEYPDLLRRKVCNLCKSSSPSYVDHHYCSSCLLNHTTPIHLPLLLLLLTDLLSALSNKEFVCTCKHQSLYSRYRWLLAFSVERVAKAHATYPASRSTYVPTPPLLLLRQDELRTKKKERKKRNWIWCLQRRRIRERKKRQGYSR